MTATFLAGPAVAEGPAIEAMQEYMEVAAYGAGIIVPQQISKDVFGSLSAQAAFALRAAGRDNILVLQTGIAGWKRDAALKP